MAGTLLAAALLFANATTATPAQFVAQYCVSCHNQKARTAGLALDTLDAAHPETHAETWERVLVRLQARSMPPPGSARAGEETYRAVTSALERTIDEAWRKNPQPGRMQAVHRLTRVEYNNAVRDLFALPTVDVKPLLPGDETADGSFDNFAAVLTVTTAHLERYLSVARHVTRLAVGLPPATPREETFTIPLHVLQEDRQSEDLPLGSRGGLAVRTQFPADGEYAIRVRLQRQYQDYLKGMGWPQRLDVRLDGKLLKRFTVGGGAKGRPAATSFAGDGEPGFAGDPEWERYMQLTGDAGLEVRVKAKAGPHVVGVAFVRELWEAEGLPQPLQRGRVIANDQVYMGHANVGSVHIGGPYGAAAMASDTPSRRAIFSCYPKVRPEERSCAAAILARLARLAYRRPVREADTATLLRFFDEGRREGGSFDHGIQFALERLLVDPEFLLRVYRDRAGSARLSDLEVATRLASFLWSSLPDDRLLALAERNELTAPATLEREVRRMLADPRSTESLAGNFAAQWLNLRRVSEVVVDPIRYPHYDESLLQAFQRETEMLVEHTLREDLDVRELLSAGYTFANERLARHYGLPGITGSRLRRVEFTGAAREQRGGILAHGALLATTSYPDRTSPVLRGKWLLNNILGLAVPPPPPGLDTTLETKPGAKPATIRARLADHRRNPSCNSCHSVIDPLGFALENFDVIGSWRAKDESGLAVDVDGATPGGTRVEGLAGLRAYLLAQPEQFPRALTAKLYAYALGRRVEYYDQPAIRQIVARAAAQNYKWSALILGITQSPAFLTRQPADAAGGTR